MGPLPVTARGNRYIVVLVDYFSLKDKSAKGVSSFFVQNAMQVEMNTVVL